MGGLSIWWKPFYPQPTTVPSALSARLWLRPTAMLIGRGGLVVWPLLLSPQPMTVPLALRRRLWLSPAARVRAASLVIGSRAAGAARTSVAVAVTRRAAMSHWRQVSRAKPLALAYCCSVAWTWVRNDPSLLS